MSERTTRLRTALLIILAVMAVAAAGYVSFSLSSEDGLDDLRDEADSRLAVLTTALFAPADKYSYLPEVLAVHPMLEDLLRRKSDQARVQQANVLLEQINRTANAAAIYVLNDKGLVIAASNWNEASSFVGQNYAFRPYFQTAMNAGSGKFYGVGTTTMLPGYYISHAISLDGAAAGVVVVKVDLSRLDDGWTRGRSKDEITVADANGVIFLSSRADWKYRPMQPLSPLAMEQLRKTHQYDGVLREPLSITVLSRLGANEQLVRIMQHARDGHGEEQAHYLMHTGRIDGSDWAVNVLVPTAEADTRATRVAIISAGGVAFLLLAVMYVWQFNHRVKEREKSRRALELAHQALEQKHVELQKMTEELRIASITDPLTGAYNRRFFFEAVHKLVSASNRHHFALSIVTIDVDHFKRINDFYGHPAGDTVLRELTTMCKESLRDADVFARFGGEEFIMALPNSDADAAQLVAERLRLKVNEKTIDIKGEPLRITISCGVSQYRLQETGIDDTLKRADEALYVAKKSGRNQVVVREKKKACGHCRRLLIRQADRSLADNAVMQFAQAPVSDGPCR